ncbi:MAG: RHS repeat-associated core domain-containing protein [Fimbriimonadaceae bacterium]|nr:RHS repeat-associated core domain-containing protein [Fimbriimonadaceae bacterium]QYK58942.1 MAG: RHS repeat-associated core domain-containing protein [Fimbriimonadaceae bacterium]
MDDQGAVSGYYDTYSLNLPTWRYYHDGQAAFEDDKTHNAGEGTRKDVTRYALGARGGDMVETVLAMGLAGEQTLRSYPLYDGHGNMVAQVARAEDEAPGSSFMAVPGAPAFGLGARRKSDAWGQVRSGSGPNQGYCASLQHRRDAESGLVYMRARYYEPSTGRFLSEDPAMDGANWYVYCANDPVNRVDPTGKVAQFLVPGLLFMASFLLSHWEPDTTIGRTLKALVSATLDGIAAASLAVALGSIANPMVAVAGGFLLAGVSAICAMAAVTQLICLMMLSSDYFDSYDEVTMRLAGRAPLGCLGEWIDIVGSMWGRATEFAR